MNRLFEILYLLIEKRTITARELSNHFEVSERTIYRDIDTLCMSGIPIYTKKGKNGGISIVDNYVLNKVLVSDEEKLQILSALQSMKAVDMDNSDEILTKLNSIFNIQYSDWISIDFSDWSNQRQEVYKIIKSAILNQKVLQFDYYNRSGKASKRIVEPIQLWFKSYTWYLRAYCREKQDVRVFKLNRMQRIEVLQEFFEKRDYTLKDKISDNHLSGNQSSDNQANDNQEKEIKKSQTFTLLIDKTQAYRVYDIFDESNIELREDGNYLISLDYQIDEWVYGLILSFGAYVTVISPDSLRIEIKKKLEDNLRNYMS
ncbi:helix-turn-helix transcriptional regulator [Anaeromicropila herbilytica]|uniref:Transcriptional regulator n=1 Tax=Anaeromicropila herbilytica TaxID=2785025 RepID=A0A7R7ID71_9FIRM|nr:YafY family protein [Anaeromicropila herbilytica]BCN30606.1 transcriptional regulator [Anaeromicropila herbilytica]